MVISLVAAALAMISAGLYAIYSGYDIIVLERGWSAVISGSIAATGGMLLLGIAIVVRELRRLPDRMEAVHMHDFVPHEALQPQALQSQAAPPQPAMVAPVEVPVMAEPPVVKREPTLAGAGLAAGAALTGAALAGTGLAGSSLAGLSLTRAGSRAERPAETETADISLPTSESLKAEPVIGALAAETADRTEDTIQARSDEISVGISDEKREEKPEEKPWEKMFRALAARPEEAQPLIIDEEDISQASAVTGKASEPQPEEKAEAEAAKAVPASVAPEPPSGPALEVAKDEPAVEAPLPQSAAAKEGGIFAAWRREARVSPAEFAVSEPAQELAQEPATLPDQDTSFAPSLATMEEPESVSTDEGLAQGDTERAAGTGGADAETALAGEGLTYGEGLETSEEPASGEVQESEAQAEAAERTVIGTYSAGGNLYVMYGDGSIAAETATGTFRFGSLDELKAFIAQSASPLSEGTGQKTDNPETV